MKKLILASLLLAALASCKKEDPAPPSNGNPAASVHENYIVLNGDNHTNDTLLLPHLLSGNAHGDSINISGSDTTGYSTTSTFQHSVVLVDIKMQPGTNTYVTGNLSMFLVGSISYAVNSLSVTISSVGSPGGYITGTYSGNFQRGNPPYTAITVTGKFSVIRN